LSSIEIFLNGWKKAEEKIFQYAKDHLKNKEESLIRKAEEAQSNFGKCRYVQF